MNIEITTRKETGNRVEVRITESYDRRAQNKVLQHFVSIHVRGSITTRTNSSHEENRSAARDRDPWSWDCWISIQGYHYLQGKRNLGTKFFFHTSKNEIQLRGLTYSEVSKRGRLILLASSLANTMRICSTTPFYVNRNEFVLETCLLHVFRAV